MTLSPQDLLGVYDDEVRGSFAHRLPTGWTGEDDGPLTRCLTGRQGFAMLTRSADDLSGDDLAALVARTVTFFDGHGVGFEWKTFDHDRADLRPMLLDAGATTEPHEALVLGEARLLATSEAVPEGFTIRRVSRRDDLDRIGAMVSAVYGEDWTWLADDLEGRLADEHPVEVYVAEDVATGEVATAAWLAPLPGTRIAGLWGGATLAPYRRRGLYRALVAVRARRAVELGYSLLQVDASDDSRPILERLGLHVVGGTQPYLIGTATST